VIFFLNFRRFRPFAAPIKCRPVRPAPPYLRRYATASHKIKRKPMTLICLPIVKQTIIHQVIT